MVRKNIVKQKLGQLKKIKKDELTYAIVQGLTGTSYGALNNRVSRGEFDYHNKGDIAALIKENRPILEEWPDVSDLENLLNAGAHIFRHWYRNPNIRGRIGAVKVLNRIRYNPDWYNEIKKGARRKRGIITIDTAAEILGRKVNEMGLWNSALHFIQPGGSHTKKFCYNSRVNSLKKELKKAENPKWLTSSQVSTEIDALVEDVRDRIPHKLVHPVSRWLLYDPSVIEQYRDAVFVRCTSFSMIQKYCERNILGNNDVKKKIRYLVTLDRIPSEKADGKNSLFYLSRGSEKMVRNIYKNIKSLQEEDISLISMADAARRIDMDYNILSRLIQNCGVKYLLTSDIEINNNLATQSEERKISLRPRIPYVQWADNTQRFLTSVVVGSLHGHIENAKEEAIKKRYNPFDGYWIGRLANSIQRG